MEIWSNLIVNRYLHRRLVWKALWGTIWCTITYPLPVVTLAKEQVDWLTKELYRKLLPAMGVNRDFPRYYRHESKMFQVMGLPEIMVEQPIYMVGYCMLHGTSNTLKVEEMRYSVEQVQMDIGMGTPFLRLHFDKFGTWTTKTCFKATWKNMGSLEIELLWRSLPSIPLHREGDTYIMANFSGLYDMYKKTNSILNRVRMSMEI